MLQKIISGGQTGVDRAALDTALELGLPCGGWCPCGRRTEDGTLPERYPLQETTSANYAQRTRWNVRDSDGTLILAAGPPHGGTALTIKQAERLNKPYYVADLLCNPDAKIVSEWISDNDILALNVAGPRGSENPNIYSQSVKFLHDLFGGCTALYPEQSKTQNTK